MIIEITAIVATLILGYLFGSIPSAVWIGKRYYGVDIREHGSHNAGTTNMLRVLGKKAAIPVFGLDYFKGFVGVTLVKLLAYLPETTPQITIYVQLAAVAVTVLGHIFPIFAGFRGGKGVATIVGAITAIEPAIMLLCFAVWFIIFLIWHYVSLASMVAGCVYPALTIYFFRDNSNAIPLIIFSFLVALMLILTHRKNISRLRAGTESKIYVWRKKDKGNPAQESTDGEDIDELLN
ncbi:MAG: glycerol-3-phosphate 1-O-acyltransferase PlsY [Rikenellaceae bacterium]